MRRARSYLQRLAAPLRSVGASPVLYPIAQAAPEDARPAATAASAAVPNRLSSAPEPSTPAAVIRRQPGAVIRRQPAAAVHSSPAARRDSPASPVVELKNAPPAAAVIAAKARPAAWPEGEALQAPPAGSPEDFPVTVNAEALAAPADLHAFASQLHPPAAAAPALPDPARSLPPDATRSDALIWGEPVALPPRPAVHDPFDPPPTPRFLPKAPGNAGATEIHIGTIEVRIAPPPAAVSPAPSPKAAMPPPAAPSLGAPLPAAPVARGYGWRFGLSQR
jgi:hypothetical protein